MELSGQDTAVAQLVRSSTGWVVDCGNLPQNVFCHTGRAPASHR